MRALIAFLFVAILAALPARADTDGWAVQIGAYDSEKAAMKGWALLTKRHAGLLVGAKRLIVPARVRGKLYQRLMIGGIGSAGEAKRLCNRLSRAGQACMTRKIAAGKKASKPKAKAEPKGQMTPFVPPKPTPAPETTAIPPVPRKKAGPDMSQEPKPMAESQTVPTFPAPPPNPLFGRWTGGAGRCGVDFATITAFGMTYHKGGEPKEEMACRDWLNGGVRVLECADGSSAAFQVLAPDKLLLTHTIATPGAPPQRRNQLWRRCP